MFKWVNFNLLLIKMCSKSTKTNVFSRTEVSNEENLSFHQRSLLGIPHTYSNEFSISQSA